MKGHGPLWLLSEIHDVLKPRLRAVGVPVSLSKSRYSKALHHETLTDWSSKLPRPKLPILNRAGQTNSVKMAQCRPTGSPYRKLRLRRRPFNSSVEYYKQATQEPVTREWDCVEDQGHNEFEEYVQRTFLSEKRSSF